MESLGRKIKERMVELDLSAHALEKRAGLKSSAVQNIIYGRSKNPSINLINSIARVLGCEIQDLIGEGQNQTEVAYKTTTPSKQYNSSQYEEENWNQTLYLKCFKIFYDLIEQKKITLKKNTILNLVEEIYNYSYGNNIQEPDNYFAKWLIDKNKE